MADRQENKKTVVVVDDEPIIRMDLGQMLEELNYEVVAEGADGFDAVNSAERRTRMWSSWTLKCRYLTE